MQKISKYLIGLGLFMTSCTKEVNLKLKTTAQQMVIEGEVTSAPGPYQVQIHKSVNFNQSNNLPPVSGALVIISDNTGMIDTLKETGPGIYKTSKLSGIPGRTYFLKVVAEGKHFNASSTMPQVVHLDTLQFDLFTSKGNSGGPEYSTLPVFNDPAPFTNSYRFIQTVNGKLDDTYFVLNDNTFNGLRNEQLLFNPDAEIKAGDSVSVEFRCIDKNTYNYFYTLSQFNTDGPYNTTPTNPPSNITGDFAYGIFSACTVQRKSAVVPKK
ncbi:DUF4249 domain-containing protein [Mucilaginibacter sp. SMC90]|uniref:DUF4249 domain-containing protein n=1 Tax=Mucilaginibacter sp. SMC90 TaxID=2929803 RepID=UPI001FB26193|nr:DUF4249 domain-containing protein [Mucilaginibacter sp. SMC90]UOE47432.1 DUF4249 domain-containing protein [Mucilaginibacter sp. SMC90]